MTVSILELPMIASAIRMSAITLAGFALLAVSVACNTDRDSSTPLSIEEPVIPLASGAFKPDEAVEQPDGVHISVEGMLYIGKDGVPGLCGFVFDSLPPLCYPPLNVENLKLSVYESLKYKKGISWSSETVIITGTMLNGVLIADD